MNTSPHRQQYREFVAEIATKAKAKLPECNGRVEKAVSLVLQGDVELHADSTATVYSSSDPTRRYEIVEGTCGCRDWPVAPHHFCQHRIAAGIARRVGERLAAPVPVEPEPVPEPWPDNDPESAPAPAVPPALPEAPASVNCHITIEGRQVQLTLRDTDESRLLQRLAAVLMQYPAPASPPAPTQGQDATPQCKAHGALKKSTKGKGWYCAHKLADGSWCPSKAK